MVTSTIPACSSALIRKAATMPRAPVIAFQPAIAGARDDIVVCSLTTEAMPTSIEALAAPAATAPSQSSDDVRGDRDGEQGRETHRSADPHRDHRAEPVGDHAPGQERDRRRGRCQDADDADVGERQVESVDVDQRIERERGDETAAVEALGERDTSEHRALAEGADGVTRREARQVARGLGAKAHVSRRHRRPR